MTDSFSHPVTIGLFLKSWAQTLRETGVDSPRLSAELVLAHALEKRREDLLTHPEFIIPPARQAAAEALLRRRASGEPVAYLLGQKEFYGRNFLVNKHTLIPRPETELLVELALAALAAGEPVVFADMGVGSGCLALTLLAEQAKWQGLAVDLSRQALAVAGENALRLGVAGRCLFVAADMRVPFLKRQCLDLLVANPPYISPPDYAKLGIEVKNFEPRLALCSENYGLAHLAALEEIGRRCLKPEGVLLLEIGSDQGESAPDLFNRAPQFWSEIALHRDLAGLPRVALARRSLVC